MPFLERQLEIISPEVIVALGGTGVAWLVLGAATGGHLAASLSLP